VRRLDFIIRAGSFINICDEIFIGFLTRADVFNTIIIIVPFNHIYGQIAFNRLRRHQRGRPFS
jgi:hypothetical protein